MLRVITAIFVTASMLLGAALPGAAETVELRVGKGRASVDVPDSWQTSRIKRGAQFATRDDEVIVWVEVYTEDTLDTILAEHKSYYADHNVIFTGKPKTQHAKSNEVAWTLLDYTATFKGKPTIVQYILMDPNLPGGGKLMFSTWASPEGDRKYEKESNSIVNSVSFTR